MLTKITVIYREEEGFEQRFNGFLTDAQHAMYVEETNGELFMNKVVPVEGQEGVYYVDPDSSYLILGQVAEGEEEKTINALAKILQQKTAYEFLVEVMMHVPIETDFEELVVPGMIKENK